jgi:hypothetical protein
MYGLNASNHSSQAWNMSSMPATLMIYIATSAPFGPLDMGYNPSLTAMSRPSQTTNRTSALPHAVIGNATSASLDMGYTPTGRPSLTAMSPPSQTTNRTLALPHAVIGINTTAPLDMGYTPTGRSSPIATSSHSLSTIRTSASPHASQSVITASASTMHTSRSTPRKNNASLHIPSHVGIDMGDPIAGSTTSLDMNTSNHSKSIFFMQVLGPADMALSVNGTMLHSAAMGLTNSNLLMIVMALFTSGLLVFMVALFLVSCAEGGRVRRRSCTEEEECYGDLGALTHYDDKEKVW